MNCYARADFRMNFDGSRVIAEAGDISHFDFAFVDIDVVFSFSVVAISLLVTEPNNLLPSPTLTGMVISTCDS